MFIHSTTPGVSGGVRTLSCGTWGPVPWPGIDPELSASEARSLRHWTTREVLSSFLKLISSAVLGLSCSIWDPLPSPDLIQPGHFVLVTRSLRHWMTREVLRSQLSITDTLTKDLHERGKCGTNYRNCTWRWIQARGKRSCLSDVSITLNRKRPLSTPPTGKEPLLTIRQEEGNFPPPPTPCSAQPGRFQQSSQWEASSGPPAPRLPLFPKKGRSSHALHLPVVCHRVVYTNVRITLLWSISLQECYKQSMSMQSQEGYPNQGQH